MPLTAIRPRWATLLYVLMTLAGLAAFATFAIRHLSSTGFWYDESMQFWMSLGIDGFGPPLVPQGSLKDMVHANAVGNLDPGGFTLIFRYWLRLGTSELWQRILPLLFMVAAMAGLGWIGGAGRKSVLFGLICSVVVALDPLVLDYATEVRAYSMEFAGVVIGFILIERLAAHPGARLALLTGLLFALFLGSRYSFALYTAAAFLALAHAYSRQDRGWTTVRIRSLAAFAMPAALAATVIFALALLPQYHARITYNGGALVQYLAGVSAAGKSARELGAMLLVNLLHPLALPLTAGALVGIVAVLPRGLSTRLDSIKVGIERLELDVLGVICLAALALSGLLWRWHPWSFPTKWSLWLHALSLVALVRLCVAALAATGQPSVAGPGKIPAATVAMLVVLLALDLRLGLYRRADWPTFAPDLAYLETLSPPAGSVAMDVHSYPTIRYFYEYGAFAGSRLFPGTFRMPHWTAPTPLITDQTRFLITGLTLTDANRVFAPARIIQDPSLPARLFRVEPAQ